MEVPDSSGKYQGNRAGVAHKIHWDDRHTDQCIVRCHNKMHHYLDMDEY